MLATPPETDSKKADRDRPAVAALKCAYSLMQQRIISNPTDMMGVLLFGTVKSRFQDEDEHSKGLSYPHCYLLTDLDVPAAADVKRLRNLVDGEEKTADLLQASNKEVSMANVLFCANQIFTTKAPNFSSRRLFLVTDNDNPHASDKALRNAAAVRAKDLYDLGVIIELFPISKPDHAFERSTFYEVRAHSTEHNELADMNRTFSTVPLLQIQTHLPQSPKLPNLHQVATASRCCNHCCPILLQDLRLDGPCSPTCLLKLDRGSRFLSKATLSSKDKSLREALTSTLGARSLRLL